MRRAAVVAVWASFLACSSAFAEVKIERGAKGPKKQPQAPPAFSAVFEPAGRDPFNFAGSAPAKKQAASPRKPEAFTLEGLIWMSDRPQAIVNGKIVEPGNRIGDAEILEIDEKGVKMRVNGKELLLKPRGQN